MPPLVGSQYSPQSSYSIVLTSDASLDCAPRHPKSGQSRKLSTSLRLEVSTLSPASDDSELLTGPS